MTTPRHIKLGRGTALISFLLGTAIFLLYFLTSSFELLFVGYGFIVLTGLINIGILISILLKASKDEENRKKTVNDLRTNVGKYSCNDFLLLGSSDTS